MQFPQCRTKRAYVQFIYRKLDKSVNVCDSLPCTLGIIHTDCFPIQFQWRLKALESCEQLRSLLYKE